MNDRAGMFGFIDKMYFKPTERGWLFKEPALWRRRTYLLTDAQKMRLVRPVRWMSLVSLIIVIVAIQALDVVSDRFHVSFWLSMAMVVAGAMVLTWIYLTLAFRPLLSGLTPTNERFTFSDQIRLQATGLPMALIIFWLVGCLAFVVLGSGLVFVDGWDWKDGAGIVFFATLGVYPAMLLVLRARKLRNVTQEQTRS